MPSVKSLPFWQSRVRKSTNLISDELTLKSVAGEPLPSSKGYDEDVKMGGVLAGEAGEAGEEVNFPADSAYDAKKINGFKWSDLCKMSNFAKLAYYAPDEDVSRLKERSYFTFKDLEAQGYKAIPFKGDVVSGAYVNGGHAVGNIFVKGNEIIVAYRGTVTGNDWASNFDALRIERPDFAGGKGIHKGFHDIYKGSRQAIRNALFEYVAENNLNPEDLDIKFTGHSLGGALAKIAALDMSTDPVLGERVTGVATFGDPRAFDFEAAKLYNEKLGGKTVRVSQSYDPVPKVATGLMGYAHVGAEVKIPLLAKMDDKFNGAPHFMDGYRIYLNAMPEANFKANTDVSTVNTVSKFLQRLIYGKKAEFNATLSYVDRLKRQEESIGEGIRV